MAQGGIDKKPGGANVPQSFSHATGKFVSEDSSTQSDQNSLQTKQPNSELPDYYSKLLGNSAQTIKMQLALNRLRQQSYDKYDEIRNKKPAMRKNVNDIISYASSLVDSKFIDDCRNNSNFDCKFFDRNGNTHSDYGNTYFLPNIIAKRSWIPMKIIPRYKLEKQMKEINAKEQQLALADGWNQNQDAILNYYQNNSVFGFSEGSLRSFSAFRGYASSKDKMHNIFNGYVGKEPPDLLLTEGACGHCIYSSVNHGTGRSYSSGGHLMQMVIDMQNANIVSSREADRLSRYLYDGRNQLGNAIYQKSIQSGASEADAKKMSDLFTRTISMSDTGFTALLMGADVYFDQHCCILNGRCITTEEDTFNDRYK